MRSTSAHSKSSNTVIYRSHISHLLPHSRVSNVGGRIQNLLNLLNGTLPGQGCGCTVHVHVCMQNIVHSKWRGLGCTRSSNKTIITMAVNKILLHVHVRSEGLMCYMDTGTSLIRLPIVLATHSTEKCPLE